MSKINRRQAIHKASLMMGGTLTASLVTGVMAGCSTDQQLDWTPKVLTAQQVIVTVSLAEQILPATSTPGAKDARIERFIDSMVAGYLSNAEKSIFEGGISRLNQRNFIKMMPEEQHNVVIELVEEARTQAPDSNSRPFFLLFKEMTLLGFFTSKIGATQVLNYDPIPGDSRDANRCRRLEVKPGLPEDLHRAYLRFNIYLSVKTECYA